MEHTSLGAYMRHSRQCLGLSLSEVARRACVDKGYLSQLETGKRDSPSEAMLLAIGQVLGVDLVTHSLQPAYAEGASRDVVLVFEVQPDGSVITVQMDRRAFLATASLAAGAAVVPLPDHITPDTVTALSDRFDWHVEASRTQTPNAVTTLMRHDFDAMTRAAASTPSALRAPVLALTARYAEHIGWMRQEAGDYVGALYWTSRAEDAARVAGWREMASYALARRAGVLLHTEPRHAAELARVARRSRRVPATIVAYAAGKEAEAWAHAGQPDAAYSALDTARGAVDRADPGDRLPAPQMVDARALVDARQSRCDLLLGDPEQVITTLAPLRPTWSTPRTVANYCPPLAVAYAQVGDVRASTTLAGDIVQSRRQCGAAGSPHDLRALHSALQTWAGRDDVDQVLTALPA